MLQGDKHHKNLLGIAALRRDVRMARGSKYGPERAIMRDPRSGLRIIRLTHCASISSNLYFEMCSFTKDEAFVVFISQRGAARDAPWDLFRARTDGLELVQLTDCDDLSGIVMSPKTDSAFYMSRGELRRMDVLSFKDEPIAELGGLSPAYPFSLASIDAEGSAYFAAGVKDTQGVGVLFKVEVASGKLKVLFEGGLQNHVHVEPDGRTVYFGDHQNDGATEYLVDADGSNLRKYPFSGFAHKTWFGDTGSMQGCLLPPGHGIVTFTEGDAAPTVITEGRYYWHSSASADAEWIIADTNWPREGLYLIHAPTRTVTYVCDPQSSCSHPQWTHPHPALSPGMRYVLFNSDMTGIGQVYLAELTSEFLGKAAEGYECQPVITSK
jgi:hypothetical protein